MQVVAPAGNFDGLRASINGGADAVYLGMPLFGARAKAQNFDNKSLKDAVEYAHLFGVKVFVTLNTIIKDNELSCATEMAKYAYSVGADAAIVQDLGLIKSLKQAIPEFALHASTQMGVHNADGAKALRDLGIERAVLARETLPSDIAEIKKTGIEIEFFVQGALCVCFSGNCYFSSLASSYSGNRGKCMQLCRKPYHFHGNRGYFLSAKDLCLYGELDRLRELGVDAVKIEGRMRSSEYAFCAAQVYSGNCAQNDKMLALKSAFNRGDYCTAYFYDDAPFNIIYSKIQGNIGVPLGRITGVRGKSVAVQGYTPHTLDGFKILRDGNEICGAHVANGQIVAESNCRVGDALNRTFDGELSDRAKSAKRKVAISVDITLQATELPSATVLFRNNATIKVVGLQPAQPAISCGISKDDVINAFKKTGEFPFEPKIDITLGDSVFMPISALNEFRRDVYRKTYNAILANYQTKRSNAPYNGLSYKKFDIDGTGIVVESGDDMESSVINRADFFIVNPRDYADFSVPKTCKPILLNMPVTMRGNDKKVLLNAVNRRDIDGVVSNNLYTFELTNKPILLGCGHNIIGNSEYPHIVSFESDEIDETGFAYVFGYAPVMTLCHCPYGKCVDCSGTDVLKDDGGRTFRMRRYRSAHCYWQLLNCVPIYSENFRNRKNKIFDITFVSKQDMQKALDFEYRGEFTRGNFNKGLK